MDGHSPGRRLGYALLALAAMQGWSSVASAQSACGDALWSVARPNGTDASSWGATDSLGNPSAVTVSLWFTPAGGSSIGLTQLQGAQVKTVAEGGTLIDLSQFFCSGQTGEIGAKATSAAGVGSAVVLRAVTFRQQPKPPGDPVLLSVP